MLYVDFCAPGTHYLYYTRVDCDSAIQVPGAQAAEKDCNVACGGNVTELCGGGDRLNIFTNGKPAPQIVPSINNGSWLYEGCYMCVTFSFPRIERVLNNE